MDQPGNDLLLRLRPLLSHDKKELLMKITDKNQKHGLRTKQVILRGYPAVIFCTAGYRVDEQEASRFILLSPEISQEKISAGIKQTIHKAADSSAFESSVNADPERSLLIDRIRAIKERYICEIHVPNEELMQSLFFAGKDVLKPRHQRDIKRFVSIVQSLAALNFWWRESDGKNIIANDEDIEQAHKLWSHISECQELNVSPFLYDIYKEAILPAFEEKNMSLKETEFGVIGVTRQEILNMHRTVTGRSLNPQTLRQQILPQLESAGLIYQETNPGNHREKLVYPGVALSGTREANSVLGGGVEAKNEGKQPLAHKDVGF